MLNKRGVSKWNRKLLNVYWYIILFSIIIELVNSFLTVEEDTMFYLYHSVVFPTLLSIFSLVLVELLVRIFGSIQDYTVITLGTVMSGIQIHSHYGMPVLYSALFLSLMVAISYYDKKKIYYSSIINTLCFLLLYRINTYINESTSIVELFTFITTMVFAAFISIAIMVQSIKLWNERNELESAAKYDSLTNLFNRRSFDKHYEIILGLNQSSYVALLDIDNFKLINDTYGHLTGDIVIKRIAEVLKEVVSPIDHCFRYGGEEFAILFVNQNEVEVLEKLHRILSTTASLKINEIQCNQVTVSIGLSKLKLNVNSLAEADALLYKAKRSGKNRVICEIKVS